MLYFIIMLINIITQTLKKNKFIYQLNENKKFFFENFLFTKVNKLYFIAIPRSGTTLIGKLLHYFKLDIIWSNHYLKPKFNNKIIYITAIRNPIQRFVSAFYHTKFNQKKTFYKNFFLKYPEVSDLIDDINDKNAISHIKLTHVLNEGLSTFYTIDYLKKNPPKFIFLYDKINHELNFFFNKILGFNKHELKKRILYKYGVTKKKKLTNTQKKKLSLFLKNDIEIYNYLLKIRKKTNSKFKSFAIKKF